MAKPPVPGRVKTRLTPNLTPLQAAKVHAACLNCLLTRLTDWAQDQSPQPQIHLALAGIDQHTYTNFITSTSDASNTCTLHADHFNDDPALQIPIPTDLKITDQGDGNLGDRLGHVWQSIPPHHPVVFLGADSPDLPLTELATSLTLFQTTNTQTAIGPVSDGGYWTLLVRDYFPQLIQNIDWGTDAVYHQTIQAAQNTGLQYSERQSWFDVDTHQDLHNLIQRTAQTHDPALAALHQSLIKITGNPSHEYAD
ncbi:TIGR04282 family arsenosugar biosynthesis glycosyltransferase [Poriferisphaera sp. WC338]|uniref:TIGR04282 family arsenosugar biosynthesis glycosyltransferase n=1 Tax=Poriferisphaera sp. WC338 TaxID=3425129 RepID=UPI003D818538